MLQRIAMALSLTASLAAGGAARAASLDWSATREHDVVEIVSTDPDGQRRETKVWVAELDGRGYVRTNDSRWYQNLSRDPNGAIKFGGAEYPVRAEVVNDDALRTRVDGAFAEKYPLSTKVMGWFGRRGGDNCLALTARPQ